MHPNDDGDGSNVGSSNNETRIRIRLDSFITFFLCVLSWACTIAISSFYNAKVDSIVIVGLRITYVQLYTIGIGFVISQAVDALLFTRKANKHI